MNINLTKNYIKVLCMNFDGLKSLASQFVNEEEKRKHEGRSSPCKQSHTDEIHIEHYDNLIIWSYQHNTSCHCHPTYETVEKKYSIDDFLKWIADNNIEVEQYTEAELENGY